MGGRTWRALGGLALVLLFSTSAFAQATAPLSGVVKDSAGGVVPGATVVVKNVATGQTFEATSNTSGGYSIAGLQAGQYTVTVSLSGFKTAVANDVRIAVGTPVTVNMTLEVGDLTETINVTSSAELVNTQTATVSATLNADQLNRMPGPTRNALNAVTFLPGVNTATTNRNSSINGLPDSFLAITLDGVSNNDNFLRSSDGFFASVTPRQDAVEAVTVTMAAAGAQVGGSGAITMAFQTRSGGTRFTGSAYEYFRHPRLNTTYFFNIVNDLPKNDVKLNQYGARLGGPIVIPGVFDGRGKAFLFANYEQVRFPNSFTRTRTALNDRALDGWFRYTSGGSVAEVNVFQHAAANPQLCGVGGCFANPDPLVMATLKKIQAGMLKTGTINPSADPLLSSYVWLSPGSLFEHQPTLRLDFNLGDKHRLTISESILMATRDPDYLNNADVRFPGAPNFRIFTSRRPLTSITLRSSFGTNLVSELRGGITALGGQSKFGQDSSNGPATFSDTGGYAIDFDANIGLTNWFTSNSPSWRSAPTFSLEETLTWQRGNHSLTGGLAAVYATVDSNGQQMVPGINLGFDQTNDPAAGLFSSARFPTLSSAQLTDMRELYALLTGRITAITGQAALDKNTNKYVAFGPESYTGHIGVYSAFLQDSWRATPTFTVTGGLRYDVQTPFVAHSNIMSAVTMDSICGVSGLGSGSTYDRCKFFTPGASGGATPQFIQLTKGTQGYQTDMNNIAPSLSLAWRPNVQSGFLRKLLGNPDQATIRAGWQVAYERRGMSDFTDVFGANPGPTISLTRNANSGLVLPGEAWPVLLSQTNRLHNASFNDTPSFPIAVQPNRNDDLTAFAPDIQIGRAQTWSIGIQRSIGADMAVEARYLGTRGSDQWSDLDYNGIRGESLIKNGFLDEFKLAMQNLAANNASGLPGRVGSFAYFGPGTNPLPIYLAYLNGRTDATNPGAYTGGSTTWTNTTLTGRLSPASPSPIGAAGDLDGTQARRALALAAGRPANFFIPNPAVDDAVVFDSGAFSDYHALQIDLRRRLSKGLSANVNYQYAHERGSAFDGFSFGRTMVNGENVRHAFKTQWDWTLPVGRGHRFGSDMHPVLDAILGGWSINGVGRVQARVIDFGNVRLVGMDIDELTDMYKFYRKTNATTGRTEIWMLPEDVILNTRRAFSVSGSTANGYSTTLGTPTGKYIAPANTASCIQIRSGDCAPRSTLVRAPWFTRFDIGMTKRFNLRGSMNIEIQGQVLNLFDNINFTPVANPGTGATIFQVTAAYTDPSNTYDPGGRLGQLMIRFNW
jgi:hypothetical protein